MYPSSIFKFGKYAGLSTEQIYSGERNIDLTLLKYAIKQKVNTLKIKISDKESIPLSQIFEFEISDTLIKITKKSPFEFNNLELIAKSITHFSDKYLENISLKHFSEGEVQKEILNGNKKYLNYCLHSVRFEKEFDEEFILKPVITSGYPEYLVWCIKNVDWFFLHICHVEYLEKLPVNKFKEIKIEHKVDGIFEYLPLNNIISWKFDDEILELNQSKFWRIASHWDKYEVPGYLQGLAEESNAREDARDAKGENFGALTDGQLGSWEDFEGNIDDVRGFMGLD